MKTCDVVRSLELASTAELVRELGGRYCGMVMFGAKESRSTGDFSIASHLAMPCPDGNNPDPRERLLAAIRIATIGINSLASAGIGDDDDE